MNCDELMNGFLNMALKPHTQYANRYTGHHQNYKLLCLRGTHEESEKTTHIMGENFCKSYIS